MLYNYFGLPDANRKWQYHFNGREDVEHGSRESYERGGVGESDFEFDESKFNEENEQMLVVRGATSSNSSDAKKSDRQKAKTPVIEEFSLCDYYLVIGHCESFKVYPFIKKRGKATDGVGNCVYEYDEKKKRIEFTDDIEHNKQILKESIKLQSILSFAAMFANVTVSDVVNIRKLQEMSGSKFRKIVSLFEVFEMVSKVYKKK